MPLISNRTIQAVVGRIVIDNFIMGAVKWNKSSEMPRSELVDITEAGRNKESCIIQVVALHWGKEGFYRQKTPQSHLTRNWNYGIMKNYSWHMGFLSERGNRKVSLEKKVCCTISTY